MGWPPGPESVISSLAGFGGAIGGVGSEVDAGAWRPVDSSGDGFAASKSVITWKRTDMGVLTFLSPTLIAHMVGIPIPRSLVVYLFWIAVGVYCSPQALGRIGTSWSRYRNRRALTQLKFWLSNGAFRVARAVRTARTLGGRIECQ